MIVTEAVERYLDALREPPDPVLVAMEEQAARDGIPIVVPETGALLHLLAESAGRIKQCAHPHCVLWFYDTSKNGTRRWHSMTTCGNRAKAARHYAAKRD